MERSEYITIAAAAEAEHLEKRSRFLSLAAPVSDESAALRLLDDLRARHRDANHNTYAYILRSGTTRFSDDGEPGGTAGMPVLEVLRRRGLCDVIVVVTRYFGGILLGAGGLVRAYTLAATLALDAATLLHMRRCTVFSLEIPYSFYGKLQNLLPAFDATVLEDNFAERISLTLRIQTDKLPALQKQLAELTAGSVRAVVLREEFSNT